MLKYHSLSSIVTALEEQIGIKFINKKVFNKISKVKACKQF